MQFALPPRKTSHPPPYAPSSRSSALRRRQLKSLAVIACIVVSVLFLLSHVFSSSSDSALSSEPPANGPKVVLVTVLDEEKLSDQYIQKVKQNRENYVKRHGYVNFFASTSEYVPHLLNAPKTWAIVPAVRHAMTLYPGSTYFFHLSPHALIMDPSLPLTSHILDNKRLESLMMKEVPVVPPDSVIKTFSHIAGKDVDLVISQDGENLCPGSFILKRGDWAKYFLDAWFDPLYRSYNFAKAENHALDHIVQWHPTVLAKLALVSQRMLNSYSPESPKPSPNGVYQEDDFLIRFAGCDLVNSTRNCEKEMEPYWQKWAKLTNDG